MKTRYKILIIVIIALIIISFFVVAWPKYGMICNSAVGTHLQKYSNLFDENTTKETYGILEIGLPFGVHPGNVKECVDYVFEQRTLERK
jgi:hypothetical protein